MIHLPSNRIIGDPCLDALPEYFLGKIGREAAYDGLEAFSPVS